jgi:aminoglycoside phosphotransferase family enzyme
MPIDDKVARLRDPGIYPDRPAAVEVIETHFSWVFLTPSRVYKLKKPVRYHGLDFTTLAARRHNCTQEVALNRRLAPAVYLGVAALTRTAAGRVEFDGPGTVLDWLVVMRRLPAQAMLDAAIRADAVDLAAVDRIAALLAAFYRENAAPAPLAPEAYRQRLAATLAENRAVLSAADGLDQPLVAALSDWQEEFLQSRSALLGERAAHLVDAHGDLRPEHVCLGPEPAIIDCLEFDARLRQLDPVDELAYLALECERLGAAAIGQRILAQYQAATDDHCPKELIDFYRAFRSCVRAKIAIWHLADCAPGELEHWRQRARDYLGLAGART